MKKKDSTRQEKGKETSKENRTKNRVAEESETSRKSWSSVVRTGRKGEQENDRKKKENERKMRTKTDQRMEEISDEEEDILKSVERRRKEN